MASKLHAMAIHNEGRLKGVLRAIAGIGLAVVMVEVAARSSHKKAKPNSALTVGK